MRVTAIKNPYVTSDKTQNEFSNRLIKYRTTLSVLKSAGLSGSKLTTLTEELAKEYGYNSNSILTK